jgi:hypothetical protein
MPVRTDPQRNASILQQLKRYMTDTRKRQYELAAEIGAPPQTVNRWFTGDTTVSKAYYNLMRAKGILRGEKWR